MIWGGGEKRQQGDAVGDRRTFGRATVILGSLLAASIVIPLALFAVASWISYKDHFATAREQLARMVDLAYEHGSKVFETHVLTAAYVDQLLRDLSDDQIRAQEALLHSRLSDLSEGLDQILDIWVVDAEGHPLVTATTYPAPANVDLTGREYFGAHRDERLPVSASYVSRRLHGLLRNLDFFQISRRRVTPAGQFAGVTAISVDPHYFENFYAQITHGGDFSSVTLLRADGAVLARYPSIDPQTLPASSSFRRVTEASPAQGSYETISTVDGVRRLLAYRRLAQYPIYIAVGIDHATIMNRWYDTMLGYLMFGVPITAALVLLSFAGVRRASRDSVALQQLQVEVSRREATEAQLRQSQKMEAVGQLTGGIAHDFNNLLTVILGQAEMLRRRVDADAPRWLRNVEAIESAARRAATLTHRLLAFSRRQPLAMKQVDVNRLVSTVSELLHRSLGEKVQIETVLAGGLWPAHTDPNQLESAIVNLAVNARDAMPRGGRLTIETANAHIDEYYAAKEGDGLDPGQYVMIAVSDTGTGMPPAVAARAFEPFFTTKDIGAGTGLGLSQVYGFVKQSSGHVKIYTEPGQGTTVKIYLPRGSAESTATAAAEPSTVAYGNGETVLVVEDEPAVRQHAAGSLADLGYVVIEAGDAEEALARLDTNPQIALLFTDIGLPGGVNGRALADLVKQRRPDLPVLFTTGYTSNAIVHHGRLDPGVSLLPKPYSLPELAEKVRRTLEVR